jgi:hypothetical protein
MTCTVCVVAPSGPEPPNCAGVLTALKERPGSDEQATMLGVPAVLDRCCARRLTSFAVGTEVSLRRGSNQSKD